MVDLQKIGAETIQGRLEYICQSLERVGDVVSVCIAASETQDSDSTAVSRLLRHGASRPLGQSMSELSSIIVWLRDTSGAKE